MIRVLEKSKSLLYTEGRGISNHTRCGDDWDHDADYDIDGGLALAEARPKLKPPKQYKVIVNNDDYTPMEFVVEVLMTFFSMDESKAARVMMSVHTKGKGICGVFSHEIAETKVDQVNEFSRINQHPLMCSMEEA